MNIDERLRNEFNDWARAGRGARMEQGHRATGEQAIELMGLEASSRVLDLGCGSGWAARLMAVQATSGQVVGIDISDEMIALACATSSEYSNANFQTGSAQRLDFTNGEFTHVFSMESIYYYGDMLAALKEVRRVLAPSGLFVAVVDLYEENEPSHQWIAQLNVPVHLLCIKQYHELFEQAGFVNVVDQRLLDPSPVPDDYDGGSFASRDDYLKYRQAGSLMMSGNVPV